MKNIFTIICIFIGTIQASENQKELNYTLTFQNGTIAPQTKKTFPKNPDTHKRK